MKKTKYGFLIILIPVLAFLLGIGYNFISSGIVIQRNIDRMNQENETFYELLEQNNVDVDTYVIYDEIFMEDGKYYIVFTEAATGTHEEGDILNAFMLEIESDIYTEYNADIELVFEEPNYELPYLWIAGGGSSYASSIAFYKRAELRRLILENQINIVRHEISVKISGSHCLGKLEIE